MAAGPDEPVALVLVGFGGVVQKVHRHALASLPQARVALIVEPNSGNAAQAAAAFPDAAVVSELEEALTQTASRGVTAAVVATPPATHAPLTQRLLEAGLHCYTEKPLAADADPATAEAACEALVAAARQHGRTGRVGFNYRFHPGVRSLHRRLRAGDLGTPRVVQTTFCAPAGKQAAAWKASRNTGGGVLLDLASHHLDLLVHLLDETPEAVRCDLRSHAGDDDTAQVALRFPSGLVTQTATALHAAETDRLSVVGDAGHMHLDRFGTSDDAPRPARRGFAAADRARALRRDTGRFFRAARRHARPRRDPSHPAALGAFLHAAAGGADSVGADFEAGRLNTRLLRLAAESAAAGGAWQPVDDAPSTAPMTAPAPTPAGA